MGITREMAHEFWRDLKGTIYGDTNHPDGGVMSTEHIAELMNTSVDQTARFMAACMKFCITERQSGRWVV